MRMVQFWPFRSGDGSKGSNYNTWWNILTCHEHPPPKKNTMTYDEIVMKSWDGSPNQRCSPDHFKKHTHAADCRPPSGAIKPDDHVRDLHLWRDQRRWTREAKHWFLGLQGQHLVVLVEIHGPWSGCDKGTPNDPPISTTFGNCWQGVREELNYSLYIPQGSKYLLRRWLETIYVGLEGPSTCWEGMWIPRDIYTHSHIVHMQTT